MKFDLGGVIGVWWLFVMGVEGGSNIFYGLFSCIYVTA
jgi:hypothetical protein